MLLSLNAIAQTSSVDVAQQKSEILNHYRALLRIDTSSPPGNETKAVDYLRKVLEAEGIPTQTFALDPNRANLVARLKGDGTKKAVAHPCAHGCSVRSTTEMAPWIHSVP